MEYSWLKNKDVPWEKYEVVKHIFCWKFLLASSTLDFCFSENVWCPCKYFQVYRLFHGHMQNVSLEQELSIKGWLQSTKRLYSVTSTLLHFIRKVLLLVSYLRPCSGIKSDTASVNSFWVDSINLEWTRSILLEKFTASVIIDAASLLFLASLFLSCCEARVLGFWYCSPLSICCCLSLYLDGGRKVVNSIKGHLKVYLYLN